MLLHKSRKSRKWLHSTFFYTHPDLLGTGERQTADMCSPEEDVLLAYAERMWVYVAHAVSKYFLYLLNELWPGGNCTGESVRNSTDSVLPVPTFSGGRELLGPFSNCFSSLKPWNNTQFYFWSSSCASKIIIVRAISWSSFVTMSSPPAKRKKHVDSKYPRWLRVRKSPCVPFVQSCRLFISFSLFAFLVLCGYFFLSFHLHPLLSAVATFSDVLQLLSIRLRISSLTSAILQLISNRLSIPAVYCQYQPVSNFFLRYLRVCPYKWLHIVVCVSLCSHSTYHDLE